MSILFSTKDFKVLNTISLNFSSKPSLAFLINIVKIGCFILDEKSPDTAFPMLFSINAFFIGAAVLPTRRYDKTSKTK